MGKNFFRVGFVASVFGALLILSACTLTVQPENSTNGSDVPGDGSSGGDVSEMAIAEWVLPDGTVCLFSGSGLTIEFDDKQANYTCAPVDASSGTTETQVILNDPVIAGPTEYLVDFATVAATDGGFELHSSEVITYTAWQIVLEDGRVCLHAGFGATMGFDDRRLNYTCDKGDSTADEVGLMGELTNAGEGVWLAQIDEIGRADSGFEQLSSTMVPVAVVSGVDVLPGGATTTPVVTEVDDALIGTTWQWIETEYGDGSVLAANDPSQYTLTFNTDGNVDVQFDCNSGGGPYTVDGSSLIFGALVTTLMGCPDGSQAYEFSSDLADVYSYVIEDGHLFLSLQLDSGIMEFAPADEGTSEGDGADATPTPEVTEEATEEATEEVTEEATEEATDEPTMEATEEATMEATEEATAEPTEEATEEPTAEPTEEATEEPTAEPTQEATEEPTEEATVEPTEEPTEEAAEEATEEATEEAATGELAGTTWQWEQSIYEGDMMLRINDPSRYTITFNADGSLLATLDCNSGRGTYMVDGSSLTFGAITSTRMGCPPDSQDTAFSEDLAAVESFVITDGNLHLTLSTDGVMEFSPVA